MKKYRLINLTLLFFLTINVFAQEKSNNFEISKNLDIYNALFRELNLNYVEDINVGQLNETAINAMLQQLDPYTTFIPESEIEDYRLLTTREYGGIGAIIQYMDDYVHITEPYFGFPAQEAGLIAGDALLEVNGVDVYKKSTAEVSELLKGQPGSEISLKVRRLGTKNPINVTLKRQKIKIDNIPYSTVFDNGIGYISLSGFSKNAAAEMKQTLLKMKETHQLKGLIIDLRNNGGGLLNEAVDIVNLFVPKNQLIVSTKGKIEQHSSSFRTMRDPIDEQISLAIMVNENSASASEIVAGSLQDFDRAVIVGQRTFGKGLVQNILPLTYNTQLKVTVSKYYIPSGRCIQEIDYSKKQNSNKKTVDTLGAAFKTLNGRTVYEGHGIMPDLKLELPESSLVAVNLYVQNMIFKFANLYYQQHSSIDSANRFRISDETFQQFVDFVKSQNFTYQTESESVLAKLKKSTEKEGYYEEIKPLIDNLLTDLEKNKEKDIIKNRSEIEDLLRVEIVERYYYQKGASAAALVTDNEVAAVCNILLDTDRYNQILNPQQ